ncbi:MAG: DUF4386 domain-containing protein [Saprospiraceae bacterium]|nr:DUF4386 domain-containing protein [Saprospiraceae bacterium]
METHAFKTEKTIGTLLMLGGILLFIPYTILSISFEYPMVLRHDTGAILTKVHEGGAALIWTWWAFAMVGLPLLPAYILLGQKLEKHLPYLRWATTIGVISLLVQMLGLLRWTFVVPVLANQYLNGNDMAREAAKVAFQVIHQYGGVVLGEHIGQLFTIIWTLLLCAAFDRLRLLPKTLIWLGYASATIYLLAQTELFATVLPGLPVVDLAGLIGSTLWLVWLIAVGFRLRKQEIP